MSREARHNLRIAVSWVHIVFQLAMVWFVIEAGANASVSSEAIELAELYRLLRYLATMFAAYAVQYSAMKLLEKSHSTHQT